MILIGQWFGDSLTQADIAMAATMRFITEAHPTLVSMATVPALDGHARRMEKLPAFRSIQQAFVAPE